MSPPSSELLELWPRMQAAAEQLSLPWRGRHWRGHTGGWQGAGVGSSIDFQDHRPYFPGDDPRHLDWRAYARTGHYIMKLYREEVSPALDLVLDASASMAFEPGKRRRVLELFCFCVGSARRAGATLRTYAATPTAVRALVPEQVLQEAETLFVSGEPGAPRLVGVPWRQGSMRVLISDLLFPGAPEAVLTPLGTGRARGLLFAPASAAESDPGWQGNLELVDCETQRGRVQQVSPALRARYAESYTRHFALWRASALRRQVALARVPAEPDFLTALRAEALPDGAVELS